MRHLSFSVFLLLCACAAPYPAPPAADLTAVDTIRRPDGSPRDLVDFDRDEAACRAQAARALAVAPPYAYAAAAASASLDACLRAAGWVLVADPAQAQALAAEMRARRLSAR